MKPFLLITTRARGPLALEERASYLTLTGLSPDELEWRTIDDAPLGAVDLDRFSGVILAGSPYTVSDPAPAKSAAQRRAEAELGGLLDAVIARDTPFLGVCYGVGTIGVHQGAAVDRTYGEQLQPASIRLTEQGRADPLFGALPDRFDAFVGHKEAISSTPAHIVVLATSAACPVQAFRIGRNVYATQFHPELDPAATASRARAYAGHGYFDPAELDALLERILAADVSASHRVLDAFVHRYAAD